MPHSRSCRSYLDVITHATGEVVGPAIVVFVLAVLVNPVAAVVVLAADDDDDDDYGDDDDDDDRSCILFF